MRKKTWQNVLSMILVFTLLVSSIPTQVFAVAGQESVAKVPEQKEDTLDAPITQDTAIIPESALGNIIANKFYTEAYIVKEDAGKRGEFYKEYILSNGVRLAAIYPSSIHYAENGTWKDIDNTLISTVSDDNAFYTNTAGAWNIRFPQSLSSSNMIGITKNGFTLQFGMAGELRSTGDLVVASVGQIGSENTAASLAVSTAQTSTAQIQQIDLTAARAAAEHPETVLDTLNSRLTYANIYPNTNVVYDLQGNQLKESIILQQYDSTLWGYRYTLDTGNLVPVMNEDQQIDLCNPETNDVVLTMPAPYMLDSKGEYSYDVDVSLVRNGSNYLLSYYLPRDWLADADRAWPVILDPVITEPGIYSNVQDRTVTENYAESNTHGTIQCGYYSKAGAMRIFMQFLELPNITSADTIIDASISLYKPYASGTTANVEVHKVTGTWTSTSITWATQPTFDTNIEDYVVCKPAGRYEWDITDIVRHWYENANNGMVFKAPSDIETAGTDNWKQFYSSEYDTNTATMPMLTITHYNTNGLENYWTYNSTSVGRAGSGYVNTFNGNLVWVRSDLGFDGNRMPVSINHIYNSNDAQANNFGMGYGWRTNYNQTIVEASTDLYVWEDGDGTKHYFVPDSNGTFVDLDGLDLTLTVTSTGFTLTDIYGNTSEFTGSKLTRMVDNQNTKSDIEITYDENGLISQIKDGVDRKYIFIYTNGLLSRISYTGKGTAEVTYITYSYSNGDLIRIIDRDLSSTSYTYSNHLLVRANDVSNYYITYAYSSGTTKRVTEVKEYNSSTVGSSATFTYSTHCTEVKDHKDNYTRYQFNDWGDLVATHGSYGHTQYTKYTLNDVDDLVSNTAEVHQIWENSDQKGTAINHFADSSFEDGEKWNSYSGWYVAAISTDAAYLGNNSMKMLGATGGECRVIGPYINVFAGETYTFSAYVLPEEGAKASIAFVDDTANYAVLSSSKIEEATNDWVRLQVSYTNDGTSVVRVYPHIAVNTGVMYVDCVQLEKADAASDYNLLENGEFKITQSEGVSYLEGWTASPDCTTADHYYGSTAANSALEASVYHMTGDPDANKYISQTVTMNGEEGDTFVLAGWARANAVPYLDGREFGLKLIFHNTDDTTTEFFSSFDPEISFQNWQYTALTAIATTAYESITVQVLYSHQANVAYFDGIQLYADRIGSSYTYDENKNVVSETNILGQTTTYEYHDNGVDLKSVDAPVGSDVSYEYDTYHNVIKMTETAVDAQGEDYITTYVYEYDTFGNVISTTVTQGSYIQKNLIEYISGGNYIEATTDGTGKKTTYGYDTDTGMLLWVQQPEDTDGTESTRDTRTYYEYDEIYRLVRTRATTDQAVEMSAVYSYNNDLLETLTTQTTKYSFGYGKFDLRTSVSVGDQLLVSYSYTEDENHYLQSLDYSNGDRVEYTYDNLGRVTSEKYYENNSDTVSRTITYTYDNAGALAITEDSATDVTTICYYDFAGRVAKLVETNDVDYYHVLMYGYDGNGNVSAMLEYVNGEDFYTEFSYDYKNRIETVTTQDAKRQYYYDVLDRATRHTTSRVDGDSTSTILTSYLSYHNATVDGQTVSTNQVSRLQMIAGSFSKTYAYSYDGNGNITAAGTTTYVYDSQNQLIRENNQAAGKTWVWTYDGSGNILSKKEYAYTTGTLGTATNTITYSYGNSEWGDLLTVYNNLPLTYDNIGNLLSDGTWHYSWQQGRQLATMYSSGTTWTFTYDSNGMRTGRTPSNGTAYTYVYNGSHLSCMTYGGNTLYFAYDAAGIPLTVNYNGTTYYYVTNLQGDVIAILNSAGTAMVQYTYDAWGKVLTTTGTMADTLGLINPLRYRGYVYDRELGMYYLQSRYYNPVIGRFISADKYISTGQGILGYNMFAYCGNNPVTYRDSFGTYPEYACDSPAAEVGRQIGEWFGNWLTKIIGTYPTMEEHYNRNASNPEFPNQYKADYFDGWNDKVSANCHQFTSPERNNKKYVSTDGKFEAIYDVKGYLVEDPRDVGTYNLISPNEDPLGHFIVDVVPWIIDGNSPNDTTEWYERVLSFLGIYLN